MIEPDWATLTGLPSIVVTGADLDRVDLWQRGLLSGPLRLTAAGRTAIGTASCVVIRDPEGTPLLQASVVDGVVHGQSVRLVEPEPPSVLEADLAIVILGAPEPSEWEQIGTAIQNAGAVAWFACADRGRHGRSLVGLTRRAAQGFAGTNHRVIPIPWPSPSPADLFSAEHPPPAQLAEAFGICRHLLVGSEATPGRGRGGAVVFLTGYSGAGKSTIAKALRDRLATDDPRPVTLLDGDEVRRRLSPDLGFDEAARAANVRRVSWVASLLAGAGGVAITALIAPFAELRSEARAMTEEAGAEFIEVWVSTPLEACEARDRKGLYARARAGDVTHFTGISSPYEAPARAEIVIDTTTCTAAEAADLIAAELQKGTP